MGLQESMTWVAIGMVAAGYIAQRHIAARPTLATPPSAQTEVDPTRWRHDGTQRAEYRDGNRRANRNPFETERQIMKELAFYA